MVTNDRIATASTSTKILQYLVIIMNMKFERRTLDYGMSLHTLLKENKVLLCIYH